MTTIPPTLSRYIARIFIVNAVFLFAILLAILLLLDVVELVRKASKLNDAIPMRLVLEMALLKLPEVGQMLLPFAVLFSAMFTFWQLTRRHELVVVRAAGFSAWQFLAPVLLAALAIGVLHMVALNPLSGILLSRYEQMERQHLSNDKSQIAVFKEGLWLRQPTARGAAIFHAEKVNQTNWTLNRVTVFFFDMQDNLLQRVDADSAALQPGRWALRGVQVYRSQDAQKFMDTYILPTNLTGQDVVDSFSAPETMSFWRLPSHIDTLEETGFDATRLRVYYHNLLSQPLLFVAMVLLAACVTLRPPRARGNFMFIVGGVFIGFTVFFLSSYLQALGTSHQIPVILAAWSPALISLLFGLTVMITKEDG